MKELEFIDWIRGQGSIPPEIAPIGPGDDCAAVAAPAGPVLVTTDQCADGVHFRLAECGPRRAGYKALARSLSDLAAMAAEAVAAVATVMAPRSLDRSDAQRLYLGLREAGDAFDCPIVGGDFGLWDGPMLLTTTCLGRPGPAGCITRSGAMPGDWLLVTGALGGSVASGKDLRFIPRIVEALALARACRIHAMIDLSDGLGSDLRHLCNESRVGAVVRAKALPLSDAAAKAEDPVASALTDGEDYELLLAVAEDQARALLAEPPIDLPLTHIGQINQGDAIELIGPDGFSTPWPGGYEHAS